MIIENYTIKKKLFIVGGLLLFTAIMSIYLMTLMGKVSSIQKFERDHIEVSRLLQWRLGEYFSLIENPTETNLAKADSIVNTKSDVHQLMGIISLQMKGIQQPIDAKALPTSFEKVLFRMFGYGDLFLLIDSDMVAYRYIESKFDVLKAKNVDAKTKSLLMAATTNIIVYSTAFAPLISSSAIFVGNMMKVISTILLLSTFILVFFTAKSILTTLRHLTIATEDLSQGSGDLTQRLNIVSQDEIGLAGKNIDNFIELVQNTLIKIKLSSEEINNSGKDLGKMSEIISQGAAEQAAATQQISASMEEMSANINQTTENSLQTEKIAKQAETNILIVNKSFAKTNQAMNEIAQKIMVINDIAAKTDFLAVNASIEAARAGEYGKGFAIVASEVRKLAERSQRAAKEIEKISVDSLHQVESSGRLLAEVIPYIQNTSKLVQEIASSGVEQNSGIEQINNSLQQLSKVTQQNSATSEEMSSGAREFLNQAALLVENISFFTLDNSGIDAKISDITQQTEKLLHSVKLLKQKKRNIIEEMQKNASTVHPKTETKGLDIDMSDKHDNDYENF